MYYHPYLANFLDAAGLKNLQEAGLKLDKNQYIRLMKCAEKKDLTDWNNWRKLNPDI